MSRLRVLAEQGKALSEHADGPPHEARSQLWGVVYAPPNPDGSRKNCSNCWMWVAPQNRCLIHARDLKVPGDHVCGYHSFGTPRQAWMSMGQQPQLPEHSGLDRVPGGTSCDLCREFLPDTAGPLGKCLVVINDDAMLAEVHSLGCCARWVGD